MSAEERAFLYYWVKEVENEKVAQLGRLLGTTFTAGEVRNWGVASAQSSNLFQRNDKVFVPLALAIRPDYRESLIKYVGGDGIPLPKDYQKGKNEVVMDLSKVKPQEFLDFLGKKKLPEMPTEQSEGRRD
jgi:hypothetical protein